jgi:hypothetical protein
MYSRFVNGNNRHANGYFLTTSRPTDAALAPEHVVYDDAVKFVSEQLKERRLRPSNLLANLDAIETLAFDAESIINESCIREGVVRGGNLAYAHLVIVACLSAYNEKLERRQAEKPE